jgi:hypothetical protein
MRTWRNRRLDLAETDRLIAGGTPDPQHAGLGELFDAIRAPASERELAGQERAMAQFVLARRDARPAPKPGRSRASRVGRNRWRPSLGMSALRIAGAVAVLMTGSTVLAAKTDELPPIVQQRAHSLFSPLGIPAPTKAARAAVTQSPVPGGASSSPATWQPATTPSASDPSDLTPVALCQAWNAARKDAHGTTLPDSVTRALAEAARNQPSVAAFCAHVLSGNGKKASPTPSATPTPSRTKKPGRDKGHGSH